MTKRIKRTPYIFKSPIYLNFPQAENYFIIHSAIVKYSKTLQRKDQRKLLILFKIFMTVKN